MDNLTNKQKQQLKETYKIVEQFSKNLTIIINNIKNQENDNKKTIKGNC
jgi:hypothetical protein